MASMKKAIYVIGLALLGAALIPVAAQAATGGTELPYKGHDTGTITLNLLTNHYEADRTGEATFIGEYTVHLEGAGTWNASHTVFTGTSTFTVLTASGDEIYGTATNEATDFTPTGHSATSVLTITGGTGRFENATGTSTVLDQDATIAFNFPLLVSSTTSTYSGSFSFNR